MQKLREGWDCPFAYVLCSVAQLRSNTAVEQIVGRVLRMPHARRKEHEDLNQAYAFSASTDFAAVLNAVRDVLVENGFQRQEVDTLVKQAAGNREGNAPGALPLFNQSPAPITVSFQIEELPKVEALPADVRGKVAYDVEKQTLTYRGTMNDAERDALRQGVHFK